MKCPASVRLSEGCAKPPGIYAEEGTAAHSLCEECLFFDSPPEKRIGDTITTELGNEFTVTEEMAAAVRVYVDAVGAVEGELLFEEKFSLEHLHPLLWGTNDACVFGNKTVDIFDFKYGKGKFVEVAENPQLMMYGLGAIKSKHEIETVRLAVVQPRYVEAAPVRSWTIAAADLRKWGDEVLKPAAERAMSGEGEPVAGDWCKWCDGAHRCPALGNKAQTALQVDWQTTPVASVTVPNVQDQTPAELARLLGFVPLLRDYCDAIEAHARYRLEHGQEVPGKKLVRGKPGNRRWENQAIAEAEMLKVLSSECYADRKILSPAQMEKKLKARGLQLPDHLVTRPEGKLVMADADSKEPAVLNAAVETFQKEMENGKGKKS